MATTPQIAAPFVQDKRRSCLCPGNVNIMLLYLYSLETLKVREKVLSWWGMNLVQMSTAKEVIKYGICGS